MIYGRAELRKWRREPAGYIGRVYNDTRGIFFDGDCYDINHEVIVSIVEYRDHFIVTANNWEFKLLKEEETG